MKLLFSPSEAKIRGGISAPQQTVSDFSPKCAQTRKQILKCYQDFLKFSNSATLNRFFATKNKAEIDYYTHVDIFNDPVLKAIDRYSGVAYDYLDYTSLDERAKLFLDQNMIIFSNLYGPIPASYPIADYRFKQGEKIGEFPLEKIYHDECSHAIDHYLQDSFVVDLRAGFYLKFYTLKQKHITMTFMKENKVVSHWAKAYRGIVARTIALKRPEDEESFSKITFEGLALREIIRKKYAHEYIFNIIQDYSCEMGSVDLTVSCSTSE